MASVWKVYDDNTIACMLEAAEVQGLINSNFVVGPGEAAVIIKDGKVQEIVTEERRKLGGWTDRNLPTFRKWFGVDRDYRVMMVSTTQFDMPFTVSELTLDRIVVQGEGVLRCSIVIEEAAQILALLGGKQAISSGDLLNRIKPDMSARVFQPVIGGSRSDEMRGSLAFLQKIESSSRAELQRILNAWGIKLDSLTVNWGLSAEEKAAVAEKSRQIEEKEKEFAHNRALKELERRAEVTKTAQQLAIEEKKRIERGEFELEAERMDAKTSLEDKQNAQRLKVAELNSEIAQLDIDVKMAALAIDRERDRMILDKKKEELALIKDQEEFTNAQTRLQFEMVQQAKRERIRMVQEHELNIMKQQQESIRLQLDMQIQQMSVQTGMIERLMTQGMSAGVVDSQAFQTMLKEQTKFRAVDRSEGVVSSVFEAEAALHSTQTMKDAEDRERKHQQEMTRLSADMMNSAKQQIPGAVVAGGLYQPQPSFNVVNVQPQSEGFGVKCPHCGGAIQKGWKACPTCGKSLASGRKCASCGADLQDGWKACPACGEKAN